jgi:hypothetical protein
MILEQDQPGFPAREIETAQDIELMTFNIDRQ